AYMVIWSYAMKLRQNRKVLSLPTTRHDQLLASIAAVKSVDVTFNILIEKAIESGYVARVLELKGVYDQGETEDEAFKDMQKALDRVLETYSLRNILLSKSYLANKRS
ncbi:MAG: type II toxin-antitoxin system HicB family antitoxin, partial [Promethearchaeota archaeon]